MSEDFTFLQSGSAWDAGEIDDLTFNFSTSTPLHWFINAQFVADYDVFASGTQFSASSNASVFDQQDIVRFLLIEPDQLDDFTGTDTVNSTLVDTANYRVSFSDIIDAGFSEDAGGELQLINHEGNSGASESLANLPGIGPSAGDIVINSLSAIADDLQPGQGGFWLLLHELGHAVGGLYDVIDTAQSGQFVDNQKYTAMSYNTYGGVYTAGFGLLDIAALQDTYGTTNTATRSGNTTYALGQGLGFDGATANDGFLYTIWDGGGTDTIDASGFNVRAEIDLRPGRFSSIGKDGSGTAWADDSLALTGVDPDPGNVAIAYGVRIENAIGTAYNDIFHGEEGQNNIINGGSGGIDTVDYTGTSGAVTLDLGDGEASDDGDGGVDTFNSIENARGSGWDDTITGSVGNNILSGGAGDDLIYGGNGIDSLNGGADDDVLDGGAGADTYVYNLGDGDDVINEAWNSNNIFQFGAGISYANLIITETVDDIVVSIAGGGSLTFDGLHSSPSLTQQTLEFSDSSEANIIRAGAADIDVWGTHDKDIIYANDLNNVIRGLTDDNIIFAGAGNDDITTFNDEIGYVHSGDSTVYAGSGDDDVLSGPGQDYVDLGDGNDEILDLGGVITVYGGSGNDAIRLDDLYGATTATLDGGSGNDNYLFDGVASGSTAIINDDSGNDTYRTRRTFEIDDLNGNDLYVVGVDSGYSGSIKDSGGFDRIGFFNNLSAATISGNNLQIGATIIEDYFLDDSYKIEEVTFSNTEYFALSDLINPTGIVFFGTNAANTVSGNSSNNTLYGFGGGDTLNGLGGHDKVVGGSGNDTINGGTGDDNLLGGAGNDTYVFAAGDGYDVINDTEGTNTLQVATGLDPSAFEYLRIGNDLRVEIGSGVTITGYYSSPSTISNVQVTGGSSYSLSTLAASAITVPAGALLGTVGNDVLYGDSSNNSIYGLRGNDELHGENGADILFGSSNDDLLIGGAGDDDLDGGTENDALHGGDGHDILYGGNGNDTIIYSDAVSAVTINLATITAQNTGGAGTDTISEVENIIGSAYADILTGSTDANMIFGGNGDDTIFGGVGDDIISGGEGNDVLSGGAGSGDTASYSSASSAVTINLATTTAQNTGGAGTDTLTGFENIIGSAFNDILTGKSGANLIEGGAGNDTMDGDAGIDMLSYANASSAVTVNLSTATAQNTGGGGTDTIANFEGLTGSAFNDTLTGTAVGNTIIGGAGNDTLNGGDGNDTLDGGSGDDTLNGGAGIDTIIYTSATSAVNVDLATTAAQNTGGAGTDTIVGVENLVGSAFNDTLTGKTGANLIEGGAGDDVMDGGASIDTLSYENAVSAITIDLAVTTAQNTGGDGVDTIVNFENVTGSAFDDTLTGASSGNIIMGGAGNDTIDGASGNDTLYGQDGLDILIGGGGVDTYVFEAESAFSDVDTIQGFNVGLGEKIDLHDILDVAFDPLTHAIADFVNFTNSGANSIMSIDRDGAGATYGFVDVAQLNGLNNLDETTLYNNGNLIAA